MVIKPKNIFEVISAKRSNEDDQFDPAPSKPTKCRPGTKAKIEVMRQRLEDGEELFNDLDKDAKPISVIDFSMQSYRKPVNEMPTGNWHRRRPTNGV